MKYPTEITEQDKKVVSDCADLLKLIEKSNGQPYDFVCAIGGVRSRLDILIKKLEQQ